ncbi:MAG: hypothetical protein GIW95_08505 [Candidatus Eremiobacteraeota bacterium]|nr:hypothetical protein [Candidatus Eremiobacteraeota bacterium]
MRLVAGALEEAGIATVVVGTMRSTLGDLPRVLITRHPRGLNFGPPGDERERAAIVREALELFEVNEATLRSHQA